MKCFTKQMLGLVPLIVVVLVLSAYAYWLAGDLAMPILAQVRLSMIGSMVVMFLVFLAVLLPLVSLALAPRFLSDETGELDVRSLWRSMSFNPFIGGLAIVIAVYGMSSTGNLAEVYKATASEWHDEFLWSIEWPLFDLVLGSPIDIPLFWDKVYVGFWYGVFGMAALLFALGRLRRFNVLLIAAVIAFFMTRSFAIMWPSAGPMFFVPDMFHIEGTVSDIWRNELIAYMKGHVLQSGFVPGTMAMPSLHVGLTAMGAWAVFREFPIAGWLVFPWVLLVWISTVMLGWHYALDGVGGLILAIVSMWLAGRVDAYGSGWVRS